MVLELGTGPLPMREPTCKAFMVPFKKIDLK
jgi:hypothetical protein